MTARSELLTNRDLYLHVGEICRAHAGGGRSLEDYLKALWGLGAAERTHAMLSRSQFAGLLEAGFRAQVPAFDPAWARDQRTARSLDGYARWERTIQRQVVDLHEMAAVRALASEQRYFGIDAPRGSRWYNFDPFSFLECAVAGTFRGWEPAEPTDRRHEAGRATSVDPAELDDESEEIGPISWDTFAAFLGAGQWYE